MMKKKILVIDDEFEIVELTKMILEKEGFAVIGADSGMNALTQLQDLRPDLILLDVNMPEMDGWEVLKVLKADDATARIPVILFTIKSEVRDKVHGIQGGAYDYITKPFSYDELVSRIQTIFDKLSDVHDDPPSAMFN
jgi:DNA-binding response OmpR family regulator